MVPIHRSAFTYCEDELPAGLDLGKGKYGGPFTTDEVGDVKSFYGILKVLFALGPVFSLHFPSDRALTWYIWHTYPLVIMNDTYSYSVCSKGVNFLLEDFFFSIFLVTCVYSSKFAFLAYTHNPFYTYAQYA